MKGRIFYVVPDSQDVPAGGVLTLLGHVEALNRLGWEAYAVSDRDQRFSWTDLNVPTRTLAHTSGSLNSSDIVVIPEGQPWLRNEAFASAGRGVFFALSFRYIPEKRLRGRHLKGMGFTHIMTAGPTTMKVLQAKNYASGLPIGTVRESLGPCESLFVPEVPIRADNSILIVANKKVAQAYSTHFALRTMRSLGKIPSVPIRIVSDLSQRMFADAVRASDIVVVPYVREGFGRVPLEAMLANCAVVTFATSGPDYLVNEVNALVVPDNRADKLVRAAVRLIRESSLKERLKHGGAETVSNFSQLEQDQDLVRFYSSLD